MFFVPIYILILIFTIIIDYFSGIYIEGAVGIRRKQFLILSLVANIGVLAFFKYFNFLNENLTFFLEQFGYKNHIPFLEILLPVGLSFHTFQAMSYTIEVYRGNQKAERHFGIYSLYVMFYPQLVAGPIERPQNLLFQFYEKHDIDHKRIIDGLKMMIIGFFMKLVVADRLGIYVDTIYNNASMHSGKSMALATFFFSFQIYCDFAGYSNIAIGSAKVMGFELMTNFSRPYFSSSVSEFWRRWHISLSTWFKDYVYITLGGNRVSISKRNINLMIVFLLSGLWHGANWTYVVWGGLNGLYLIIEGLQSFKGFSGLFKFMPTNFKKVFSSVFVFLLISVSWIFFRSENVSQGSDILVKILRFQGNIFYDSPTTLINCFLALFALLIFEFIKENRIEKIFFLNLKNQFTKGAIYVLSVIYILLMGVFDGGQFIYFQF